MLCVLASCEQVPFVYLDSESLDDCPIGALRSHALAAFSSWEQIQTNAKQQMNAEHYLDTKTYDCSILHPDCQELQSRICTIRNKLMFDESDDTGMVCHYIIVYSTTSWELPQSVSNVLGPWILRICCAVTCQTEHVR